MKQLTLAELFGVNAFQDGQVLTIKKSDLPLLTPAVNNTAESLLIAILVKALNVIQGFIETETGEAITDENGTPLEFNNQDYYDMNLFRWRDSLTTRNDLVYFRFTIVIERFISYEN